MLYAVFKGVFFFLLSTPAVAQPTVAEVQAWFDSEWDAAKSLPELGDASIGWRLDLVYIPPRSELERLRREVPGKPDHPEKHLLQAYEERLRGKPTSMPRRLWSHGPGQWRWNTDLPTGEFIDTVVMPKQAWSQSSAAIAIVDPRDGYPMGVGWPRQENTFWPELAHLLFGGLSVAGLPGVHPRPVALDGESWRVEVILGDTENASQSVALEYQGRWDAGVGRGFVERLEVVANGFDPSSVGETTLYHDWEWNREIGRWVARQVEFFKPGGRADRVLVFEAASLGAPGEFDRVTALPGESTPDPVRGSIDYAQITDYRKGVVASVGPDGTVHEKSLPQAAAGMRRDGWYRVAGWVAGGCVVLAVLAAFVRRRLTN